MKTKSLINAALIGCGRIAKKHVDALRSLESQGVNIVGFCDLEVEKCSKFLLDQSEKVSDDFCEENFLEGCDLAVVLTESGNHYNHARTLLQNGVDVLIEKPVTLQLEHAEDLRTIEEQTKKKIYVVKQNRFNEPVQRAKEFVEFGYLGKPQIGTIRVRWCRPQEYYDQAKWRGTWHLDGGVISNQASHHIDLLRWFMGPVKSVYAIERKFSAHIEAEDTIIATLEFESGAVGTIEATTSTRPKNLEGSFSIQGDKGSFEVSGFAVNEMRYLFSEHGDFHDLTSNNKFENNMDTTDVYGSSHKAVYGEILKDRMGLDNASVTIEEAIKSLELIHLIYKSVELQRPVSVEEPVVSSERLGREYFP